MSKASKNRACPAVGREIPVSDCVAHRHSSYACPAECLHNPFAPANYSRFLELEGKLDRQSMDYLMEHAADRPAMEKALQRAQSHPSLHAMHAWYEWNLFFAPGADGLTCCERWEKAGFSELKSDQRVLQRAKMKTRMALLEIHRVLDGERVEAVDLFAPDAPPMLFQDRGLAGMAVRFACVLTWIYPLPHFWRLSGTAAVIPDMSQFSPEEIVMEIVRHLGGPATVDGARRWLAENFLRFDDALQATSRARRMQMFAGMDAKFGKAVYELQAPFAECRTRLDQLPDVEPDDLSDAERQEGFAEARVWFTESVALKQAVPPGGRAVLGRVLLGQAHWRLEAFGGERFAQLRRQFEKHLGQRVRFTGERLDDLGTRMAAKEPAVNESLVPSRLLGEPQKILMASSRVPTPPTNLSREEAEFELMRAADRAFLDDEIPALDKKTPREAARNPALRPRLIRLLKQRVQAHDERNRQTGRTDDINWLLRELGVDEIIFDPPPWRPPPPDRMRTDELPDEEDFGGEPKPNPNLPPAPPLPAVPLSMEEAAKRMDAAVNAFATAADAEAAIFESGATLIDDADELTVDMLSDAEAALFESGATLINDVDELTVDMLSDAEFSFCLVFLLQAWFVLVPPGHRPPKIHFPDLAAAFDRNYRDIEEAVSSPLADGLVNYAKTSCQPELLLLLTSEILKSGKTAPKKIRPSPESLVVMLALVKAIVEELDAALRRRVIHRL